MAARDVLERVAPRGLARQVNFQVAALDDARRAAGVAHREDHLAGLGGGRRQLPDRAAPPARLIWVKWCADRRRNLDPSTIPTSGHRILN
jgi:hypothetical protein